jgi:GT2 family glycosyltransferase/2-polyprenyl-3-methyl-5-hydroxy-6-metoxy-1,4-benzoquinol methylase
MSTSALRYPAQVDVSDKRGQPAQIVMLTGPNKRVLEVGPATGYITEALQKRGCRVTAIEIDPEAAESAARFCERMIVGDVEQIEFPVAFQGELFDVAVFGEILEHLVDPHRALVEATKVLRPGGYVVASVPNVAHGSIRLALMCGAFPRTQTGLLDYTHIRFFTRKSLAQLFRQAGYVIRVWRRVTADPFATELGLREGDYPPHLVASLRQDTEAMTYQFVVKAVPIARHRAAKEWTPAARPRLRPAGEPFKGLWRLEEDLARTSAKLAENAAALAERDAHLAERDALLAQKDAALADKDAAIADKDSHIANIEATLHHANVQAAASLHQLEQITNSVGYRLLERVRRPIRWLTPEGTRRRGAFVAFSKGLNIIMTRGWRAFFARLVRVREWLPRLGAVSIAAHPTLDDQYQLWLQAHALTPVRARRMKQQAARLHYRPLMSIVMPVYNPEPAWLRDAIESVRGQLYDNWELCIADDGSTRAGVRELLEESSRADERIKVTHSKKNQGIAAASNAALALASGEFIGLLDHDDELTRDALFEVVKLLNERQDLDYIYSDEDKKEPDGRLVEPSFKPGWSPDLLMSVNYVTHFSVFRKTLIDDLGGFRRGYDGSQDYDLVLRATEITDKVAHIAEPLYTWRKVPGSAASSTKAKGFAYRAGKKALRDALARRGLKGEVLDGLPKGRYRVRYRIVGSPKVAIIIPTRDRVDMLRRCVESIEKKSSYRNYEIIVVDNSSREQETLDYLSSLKGKVIKYPHEFNFAKIINTAARETDGDALLLLNNDTEIITADWIEAMLEHGQRPEVAAVGARLIYPDGRVQHEGIIIGLGGGSAGNVDHGGYFGLGESIRNCSAVTGACMLTRSSVFWELGGFDDRLGVAFNDVDFCLRARDKGYVIVYTPYALLYHHESASRGTLHPHEDEKLFRQRWGDPGEYHDPYYNPNLDLWFPFNLRV